MDSDKVRIGGLWKEESKSGGRYLSGKLSATSKLLVLPNTYKKTDKDPDYIVYLAPVKERETASEKPPEADGFL